MCKHIAGGQSQLFTHCPAVAVRCIQNRNTLNLAVEPLLPCYHLKIFEKFQIQQFTYCNTHTLRLLLVSF